MSRTNLIGFLDLLADRADLLDDLKSRTKEEVLTAAAGLGLPFTNEEFDSVIWDLEIRLAERRGEDFSEKFSLWHLMWGQYYLEYLVADLRPSLQETGLLP